MEQGDKKLTKMCEMKGESKREVMDAPQSLVEFYQSMAEASRMVPRELVPDLSSEEGIQQAIKSGVVEIDSYSK